MVASDPTDGFRSHLLKVAAKERNVSATNLQELEALLRRAPDVTEYIEEDKFEEIDDFDEEEPPASLLDALRKRNFRTPTISTAANAIDSLVERLAKKAIVDSLLEDILSLLSSVRSNDEISSDLVELVGFDDLDLISEVLSHRNELSQRVSRRTESEMDRDSVYSQLSTPLSSAPTNPKLPVATPADVSELSYPASKRRIEESLQAMDERPLFTETALPKAEVLPHVYSSSANSAQNTLLSMYGAPYLLPLGTERSNEEDFEEVTIPPSKPVPPRAGERLIAVSSLDPIGRGSFPGYTSLNRIQSIVYPTAFQTNENMLICAPTGAGKTDVAMLTILRTVDLHRSHASDQAASIASTIRRDEFKIIYVAPMKALAAEIVRKLSKRLAWLSLKVRELTGDMQLTKAEIAETQMIVTTPEKWDVVTRKPTGEGELASKVKLLIVDEVHLLNEERGAVIETIVARTLRQVESTQSLIRIVGLSATLPNYVDVADFLRVSRYTGLFFFDSSFRPVPLEQHFIGIKGKAGSARAKKSLDRVVYEKVEELVREGHQIMVFVHARKETVNSALALREAAMAEGTLDLFDCAEHPRWTFFERDISTSRNKELKMLFKDGFGIHHAGMLRSDRNMVERMFEARAIKVLCCTATLAWGVNLPAHAVIIKGTQVYDSGRGAFVDLSVLDVLQIFGRAGRPGMESSGIGFICTSHDKLDHYLGQVTSQHAIESKSVFRQALKVNLTDRRFVSGIIDSLNAEIALGTVTNITEAVQWLGYTYLFVRMCKNPMVYGMAHDDPIFDPRLAGKRNDLVNAAARKLAETKMIQFDPINGHMSCTDVGRIAAKFYIRHSSIEIFNKELRASMSEADVLAMVSMSTEFNQIQVRESEVKELKTIMEEVIPAEVKGGTDTAYGKVNILLQGAISQVYVEDFALVSDMAYVIENGGRIVRALLEMTLSRKWADTCAVLMAMSKAIEKRMWPFEHPLKQFKLSQDLLYNLERWADDYSIPDLASMSAAELGVLVHMNERHGAALLRTARNFPALRVGYKLRPLTHELVRIVLHVETSFDWNKDIHGSGEPFWLWIEEGSEILQWSSWMVRPDSRSASPEFVISIAGKGPDAMYAIRILSDRWLGAEQEIPISFEGLIMPEASDSFEPLLPLLLLPLPVSPDSRQNELFGGRVRTLNAIQMQSCWTLLHTKQHSLLSAPTGSGKTTLGLLALRTFLHREASHSLSLIVIPTRTALSDILSDVQDVARFSRTSVQLVSGPEELQSTNARVKVATPDVLLRCLPSSKHSKRLPRYGLLICESLESLSPQYELTLALLLHEFQHTECRWIGLCQSIRNHSDLANWLRIPLEAVHAFRPTDRDQALSVEMQSFTLPHSAALMKAMVKPAHAAIRASPQQEVAIVFVPSRGQCRFVAGDLITRCAVDLELRGYLPSHLNQDDIYPYLQDLVDRSLVEPFSHGIGIWHNGVDRKDRRKMLSMIADGLIRVVVSPREACWTIPIRAGLVVVMGTQYYMRGADTGERGLQDYTLQELTRMQGRAVRHGESGRFLLLCHSEARDVYARFLSDGIPLESSLYPTQFLADWYASCKGSGIIASVHQAVDCLSFTYLRQRLQHNPCFYDAKPDHISAQLSTIVDNLERTTAST